MDVSLRHWLNLYIFPPGRRHFVLAKVGAVAEEKKLESLAQHCQTAVQHEANLRNQRRKLAEIRNRRVNPRLTALDPKIDKTLGAIYRIAHELASTLDGTPEGELASRLLEQCFPNGLAAITNKNYVEQSTELRSLIALLRTEHSEAVERLGVIKQLLDRLENMNNEFRAILEADRNAEVNQDEIRAGEILGQENLLQALAMILGDFPSASIEHVENRQALLRPIIKQNEAIKAYYRSRRALNDVDPDTGEEMHEVVSGSDNEPLVNTAPADTPPTE